MTDAEPLDWGTEAAFVDENGGRWLLTGLKGVSSALSVLTVGVGVGIGVFDLVLDED